MTKITINAIMLAAFALTASSSIDARPQRHAKKVTNRLPAWQKPDSRLTRLPGSWQLTREMLSYDATGLSGDMAELAKAGKASVGQKEVSGSFCLRAKSVRRDSLMSRLQDAVQFGNEWKVDRAFFGGDQVIFEAHMSNPDQGSATMKIEGLLTRAKGDLTLTTDSQQPGGGTGHIRTVSRMQLVRLGKCKPDEDIAA